MRAWRVDIGDKVKEGELLAEIETPELDQEQPQAKAQLLAGARRAGAGEGEPRFCQREPARYKQLGPPGVASQATWSSDQAQAEVAEAAVNVSRTPNVAAQLANISRLTSSRPSRG